MWVTFVWPGKTVAPMVVGPGFIPTTCTVFLFVCFWLFFVVVVVTNSLWGGNLAQPRYDKEGLGLSLKQCVLPSLMNRWRVERECVRNGRRKRIGNGDLYFK